ncbi:MAG: tyrosine-type recombinase/integrase [Pseudonocardiaceae bacterium]
MPVDDLWFSSRRAYDSDGLKLPATPTKRHGRGRRWRVRYTDDAGAKVQRLFGRKPDAQRFDAAVRTDVDRGVYIDPGDGAQSFADYAAAWQAAQLYRGSTAELVERTFRRHVNPVLGQLAMSRVRSSHVQAWVKGVDLAPGTTRIAYSYLVAMFGAAVRDRVIATSPCVGVTLPALDKVEHLVLTPVQVHKLARALPKRYRALVYVGAGCGLRHGEALGLEVGHVDFLRREVHVVQQLTVRSRRSPYLGPVKTRASRRTVELPKVTADALAEHLAAFAPAAVDVVDETDPRNVRTRAAALLFTTQTGRPIHRATWSHLWRPARVAAGLPEGTGYHALRHYFATLLIHAGASVKTVQMALGHSTPTVTLDTYVGLWPDQIDRTRTLVDEALTAAPTEGVSS